MKIWQLTPGNPSDVIWNTGYVRTPYRSRYIRLNKPLLIRARSEERAREIASDEFFNGMGLMQQVKDGEKIPYPPYNYNSPFKSTLHMNCEEIDEDDSTEEGILPNNPSS